MNNLKAHKSMDGYNFFCSSWVSNLTIIGNHTNLNEGDSQAQDNDVKPC